MSYKTGISKMKNFTERAVSTGLSSQFKDQAAALIQALQLPPKQRVDNYQMNETEPFLECYRCTELAVEKFSFEITVTIASNFHAPSLRTL